MNEICVQVHTPEGPEKGTPVETQRNKETRKFLDRLLEAFDLRSKDAQGSRTQWHICDREGKKLNPDKTLGDNRVSNHDHLYIREESREPTREHSEDARSTKNQLTRNFVRDMHLHAHASDRNASVQAPRDEKTSTFLDRVRQHLNLSGSRWHIYDREGKKLDPNKSLGENGVSDGDDLYFREEYRPPGPTPHHGPGPPKPVKVLKRCENGHYYDLNKFGACPECELAGLRR
jgi:hypothetical protein